MNNQQLQEVLQAVKNAQRQGSKTANLNGILFSVLKHTHGGVDTWTAEEKRRQFDIFKAADCGSFIL